MKLFEDLEHYWEKRVKQYGRRAVLNIGHAEEDYEKITELQKNEIFPYFRNCLRGDEKIVVDFGCGPGRFTHDLAQMIHGKAVGVDLIDSLLAIAPRHEDVEYKSLIKNIIPIPDESADVVWICLVLGGLRNESLNRAVQEVRRVLKKGGLLFLIENTSKKQNAAHWFFRSFEDYQKLFEPIPLTHLHDYDDLDEQISIMAGRKQ